MIRAWLQSSTTYLVSLVLLSCVLLGVFIRASQVFLALQKLTKDQSTASPNGYITLTGSSFLPISVMNRIVFAAVISVLFGLGTGLWNIMDRFHRSDLVKLVDVHVLHRFSRTIWCMDVPEAPHSLKRTVFSAVTCDPLEDDVVAGATLPQFYYVIDQHLHCYDWKAEHAGYTVVRRNGHEPILSAFAGSPTASCSPETNADPGPSTEAMSRAGR